MTTPTGCAGVNFSTKYGTLTINGVVMHRAAWDTLNVRELWLPGTRRGTDVKLPGVPGVLSMPRRFDARRVTLQMVLSAEVDHTGAPVGDLATGLEGNIDWLRANLTDPFVTGADPTTGTVLAHLVMPSGAVREGRVTVEDFTIGDGTRRTVPAALDITIAAGVLA